MADEGGLLSVSKQKNTSSNGKKGERHGDNTAYYAVYNYERNKGNDSESEHSEAYTGDDQSESSSNILADGSDASWLHLVTSNLKPEHECLLRVFLYRRLRKGTVYVATGNVSGMEFSLEDSSDGPAVCFYVLLNADKDQPRAKEVIFCLLCPGEKALDLFQSDLIAFCQKLMPMYDTQGSLSTVEAELKQWYHKCIQYVCRVTDRLGTDTALLLQAALEPQGPVFDLQSDPRLAADILSYLKVCTITNFLQSDQKDRSKGKDLPVARLEEGRLVCDGLECNVYCTEWARLLTGQDTGNPFRIRKVLDAFKLKTIKDMNVLKRLVKQAEIDHYALYRAYSFLQASGNSEVLLNHMKMEGSSSPDIVRVLEDYLREKGYIED